MDNQKSKTLICFKEWKNKDLFKINVYKEFVNNSNVFTDVVFIEIHQKFTNKVSMKLTLNELRDLKNACKELYNTGASEYKKFTNSRKSTHTQKERTNSLSIAKQKDKENYYINYSDGINSIPFGFNKIQFLSFIESLNLFCKFAEEQFYI